MRSPLLSSALLALSLSAGAEPPPFRKVVVIVLENTAYEAAASQPFLSELASRGALLSNYHGITHPSQPNYIALAAGDTLGVKDNKTVDLKARHLGDLVEEKGKTWRVYAQGYPGRCFLGAESGDYVRKHVPFLSFKNVQKDAERCARVTDESSFAADVQSDALADYSLYVPDLRDDGHDTGVAHADRWLSRAVGPLLSSWPKDALLVVTFDENNIGKGKPDPSRNRVFTALFGAGVAPGSVSASEYDHYSLVRTIQWGLGLDSLGRGDAKAALIDGVWR